MEALPRGNGWKLMTTGGAAKAQVLDSCPLTIVQKVYQILGSAIFFKQEHNSVYICGVNQHVTN